MKKTLTKEKKEGFMPLGKKKVLIAKVRNTVVIQTRQGKWIPVSVHNLNFLFPVLLNTILS